MVHNSNNITPGSDDNKNNKVSGSQYAGWEQFLAQKISTVLSYTLQAKQVR